MGIDCKLWCKTCNMDEDIGRQGLFSQAACDKWMNQKLDNEFALLAKKIGMVQGKMFSPTYGFTDQIIVFLTEHNNHEVWLINDFFEEEAK